jgi:hypothetical protein
MTLQEDLMQPRVSLIGIIKAFGFAAAVFISVASVPLAGNASSHREAPLITTMPKTDGTDFYMFNSYEPGRAGFVTIVADYQPLEDPFAGPNYYTMDPEAQYTINLDTDGDALPEISFVFRFTNTLQNLTLPVAEYCDTARQRRSNFCKQHRQLECNRDLYGGDAERKEPQESRIRQQCERRGDNIYQAH